MDLYGRVPVVGFFATVPAQGRLETIRLVGTRANGQPALAAYETGDDGRSIPYGLMVFTLAADGVTQITGFPGVEAVEALQPAGPGG